MDPVVLHVNCGCMKSVLERSMEMKYPVNVAMFYVKLLFMNDYLFCACIAFLRCINQIEILHLVCFW